MGSTDTPTVDQLASWLESVLWYVANPDRGGRGECMIDALKALHAYDPEAARRASPALASVFDRAVR